MKKATLAVVLLLVPITAVIVFWFLRNSIIERLSGPALAQYSLEIVDVSLDALASRDARIGYLELQHASGTLIAIENLQLAIRPTADGRRRYRADRIFVKPETDDREVPISTAMLLRQLIAVPDTLPAIDVYVDELLVAASPPIKNAAWSVYQDRQTLELDVAQDRLEISLRQLNATQCEARLELIPGEGSRQMIVASIREDTSTVELNVDTDMDLTVWQSLLARLSSWNPGFAIEAGSAGLALAISVPDDTALSTKMEAIFTPSLPWIIRQQQTTFRVEESTELRLAGSVPDDTWNLAVEAVSIRAVVDGWPNLNMKLEALSCHSGIECTLRGQVEGGAVSIPPVRAKSAIVSAAMKVHFDEGLTAVLTEGATLSADGLTLGESRLQHVDATVDSEASVSFGKAGWRFSAETITARIDKLDVAGLVTQSTMFLEATALAGKDDDFSLDTVLFVPRLPVSVSSNDIVLPGVRGAVTLVDQQLAAKLTTVGLTEDGAISATFDLTSGSGNVIVDRLINSFAARPLKKILLTAPPEADISAGTVAVSGTAEWRDGALLEGSMSAKFADIAGFYSTIAFAGVSTGVDFQFDTATGSSAKAAEIFAELVDIGIPLRNISAHYQLYPQLASIDVSDLRFAAFDGTVRTEPFSLSSQGENQTVLVKAESLDLAKLLTVQEFESVDVTGRIDGAFPVTIGANGIRVDKGRIEGIRPGGVIRYKQGQVTETGAASAMGMATKALSNFEYETLTSDVDYLENGDLVLKMQIRGRNPDMDGGRPIVLNLGVENNIPQMLRSLQASRSIEDILERRMSR